mmetsp:Transcript_28500/g.45828  ORF Transcript_28500/g.45828 Transcript_28500/m.45828 type:complete len:166 (-) Transcript_28500:147-644(-)|eukprot:CAMPEP_0169136058 /NCGR_PEP_ID=MMETSP1015-20121227/40769_1 /TAXON_ID=342587 /ORGANISM="Karlodinium micrum, Strain CCMP2283" /LENGTH=165 /DNA_ID=CAMNT_0009200743 /DNA_START=70 /DNA_END=567 /DNA_ORIENTATION=+
MVDKALDDIIAESKIEGGGRGKGRRKGGGKGRGGGGGGAHPWGDSGGGSGGAERFWLHDDRDGGGAPDLQEEMALLKSSGKKGGKGSYGAAGKGSGKNRSNPYGDAPVRRSADDGGKWAHDLFSAASSGPPKRSLSTKGGGGKNRKGGGKGKKNSDAFFTSNCPW